LPSRDSPCVWSASFLEIEPQPAVEGRKLGLDIAAKCVAIRAPQVFRDLVNETFKSPKCGSGLRQCMVTVIVKRIQLDPLPSSRFDAMKSFAAAFDFTEK